MRSLGLVFLLVAGYGAGHLHGRATPVGRTSERVVSHRAMVRVSSPLKEITTVEMRVNEVRSVRYTSPSVELESVYLPTVAEFVMWYRVHAPVIGLPPRGEDGLDEIGVHLIEPLRRIPRPEVLRVLMQGYDRWSRLEAVALDAEEDGETRRLLAHAARDLFEFLELELARSDLLLLVNSAEWEDELERIGYVPPETSGRLAGADPFAAPWAWRDWGRFAVWYRAYHEQLELPSRTEEMLDRFEQEIVKPLDSLPRRELLGELMRCYAAHNRQYMETKRAWRQIPKDSAAETRSQERLDDLYRRLLKDLERILPAVDFNRLRYSAYWEDEFEELGLGG
jgi:hypothetical protein